MKLGLSLRALALAGLMSAGCVNAGSAGGPMSGMDHSGMQMPGSVADSMRVMGDGMNKELKPLKGRAFDIRFAQLMTDHHQMALDMARMEVKSGQDARVKAAAQKVIVSQQKEIALMKGWIKTWTGQAYRPKSMSMPMPMAGMGSTDRWFLEGMIPHHQGAVEMSRLVPTRTQSAQVRKLAAQIIQAQQAEINQYTTWLKTVK